MRVLALITIKKAKPQTAALPQNSQIDSPFEANEVSAPKVTLAHSQFLAEDLLRAAA